MANIVQMKDSANAVFYPQTHEKAVIDSNGVNLQTKLQSITTPTYVTAWDGASTPVVANIPAGVSVTYNTTTYTGTLAASASTANKTYLVSTGTTDNYNRYVTQLNGSTYSWQNLGSTEIDLSDYATKEELGQLDQKVDDFRLDVMGNFSGSFGTDGYLKKSDGSYAYSANFSLFKFNAKSGEKVTLYARVDSDVAAIATSSDGVTFSSVAPGVGGTSLTTYEYVLQADAVVAVSFRKNSGTRLDVSNSIAGQVTDLSETITKSFDDTQIVSSNLLDMSEMTGGYYYIYGHVDDASYQHSDYIPVEVGTTYSFQATSNNARNLATMRFVMTFDSDKNRVNDAAVQNVSSYTVPSGVSYVIITIPASTTLANEPAFVKGSTVKPYEAYFPAYIQPILKESANNTPFINSLIDAAVAPLDEKVETIGKVTSLRDSFSLAANAIKELGVNYIRKNTRLEVYAGAFTSIRVGLGYEEYRGAWIDIDGTNITVYKYVQEASQIMTAAHGLDLTAGANISIKADKTTATITIVDGFGTVYSAENVEWWGGGKPFVTNLSSGTVTGTISFFPGDIAKKIWIFGDSYLSYDQIQRWPYYTLQWGFENWLLSSLPGIKADATIASLEVIKTLGNPTYALWAVGMNDISDASATVPDIYWKAGVDTFLAWCAANDVIPIFATIPSAAYGENSIKYHEGKNYWIRNSGYRYIDIAEAVGAQADGNWREGLKYSGDVHPTAAGAKVMAGRVLVDFPEITIVD